MILAMYMLIMSSMYMPICTVDLRCCPVADSGGIAGHNGPRSAAAASSSRPLPQGARNHRQPLMLKGPFWPPAPACYRCCTWQQLPSAGGPLPAPCRQGGLMRSLGDLGGDVTQGLLQAEGRVHVRGLPVRVRLPQFAQAPLVGLAGLQGPRFSL